MIYEGYYKHTSKCIIPLILSLTNRFPSVKVHEPCSHRHHPSLKYNIQDYNIQDYNRAGTTITVPLFDQEMQYLHDNGFKVLLLNQFGFDPNNNVFYLKNVPSSGGTTTNAATLSGVASYSIAIAK